MSAENGPGRRGYAAEFKQRALKRLASGEVSLRQVAKEFDVSVPTLIKWRKEEPVANAPQAAASTSASTSASNLASARRERQAPATELERLREEVEQLKQERDRLRQGIAILAGVPYKATS